MSAESAAKAMRICPSVIVAGGIDAVWVCPVLPVAAPAVVPDAGGVPGEGAVPLPPPVAVPVFAVVAAAPLSLLAAGGAGGTAGTAGAAGGAGGGVAPVSVDAVVPVVSPVPVGAGAVLPLLVDASGAGSGTLGVVPVVSLGDPFVTAAPAVVVSLPVVVAVAMGTVAGVSLGGGGGGGAATVDDVAAG